MNLQNGAYYRNVAGDAVHCQLEADGLFHIYDIHGSTVEKIEQMTQHKQEVKEGGRKKNVSVDIETHVEGWQPIGKAEFDKDKLEAKEAGEADPSETKKPAEAGKGSGKK